MHDVIVQLKSNLSTFETNVGKIRLLLEKDFLDESVILSVTIFEVFLRDTLKSCKSVWFYHEPIGTIGWLDLDRRVEYKQKIRDYLESIGAYDDFLRNYYVYQDKIPDPEMDSVFSTLFESKRKKRFINFQNLNEVDGARKAYLAILDIDLMILLNGDENISKSNWSKLNDLVKKRHDIIHNAVPTKLTKNEITSILDSLEYLKKELVSKILGYYQTDYSDLEKI